MRSALLAIILFFQGSVSLAVNQEEFDRGLKLIRSQILPVAAHYFKRVQFGFEQVPAIESATHTRLRPLYSDAGLLITLQYDTKVIETPELMIRDLAVLRAINTNRLTSVTNAYVWSELASNALKGDAISAARIKRIEMDLLKSINGEVAADLLMTSMPSLVRSKKALTDVIDVTSIELTNASKKAAATEQAAKQQFTQWEKEDSLRAEYERAEQKLNDLVLANDRAGVRKLIEAYLPWDLMESFEAGAWKLWLEAIEHPSVENSVLAFRGVEYGSDKVQRLKLANGEQRVAFLSTVLTKNQGNYSRRLRSLRTNRLSMGDTDSDLDGRFVGKISDQMYSHSLHPKGSNFLSFSLSTITAARFAGKPVSHGTGAEKPNGGYLAVRIDSRRLIPNINSPFETEQELLAPLLIFPDEVVVFQEIRSKKEAGSDQDQLAAFEKAVRKKTKGAITIDPRDYGRNAFRMYQDILSQPSFGVRIKCENIF